MGYARFTGVTGPDDILQKTGQYLLSLGWNIIANAVSDYAIDGSATQDGVKLVFADPGNELFVNMRSANGRKIFPDNINLSNGAVIAQGQRYPNVNGIGMTCSAGATSSPASGLWYDQPLAPRKNGGSEVTNPENPVIGVGIPCLQGRDYTLVINVVNAPTPLFVMSVLDTALGVWQHLSAAITQKLGAWQGGTIFSGSRSSFNMPVATWDANQLETNSAPLYGTQQNANTFLRIDVDAAPLRNPPCYWASAGQPIVDPDFITMYTRKQLATPIKSAPFFNEDAQVPHYRYLQSQSPVDVGRDNNTLNCISVNLPITLYVIRDPDQRRNYSPVGYVPGIFFISTRNVADSQLYEIKYPQSGNLHQVFPMTKRRGKFGFDGFSVQQVDSAPV